MINIIFFDIDGTTYQHNIHNNPASTKLALNELKNKGYKLVICTSRSFEEMKTLPSDFTDVMDCIICCGGAQIIYSNEDVENITIDHEEIVRGFEYFDKNDIPYRYVYKFRSYLSTDDQDITIRYKRLYNMIPDMKYYNGEKISHLLFYTNDKNHIDNINNIFKSSYRIDYGFAHECLPENVNKGEALRKVAAHFGFSADESAAFGDGNNDVEMLKTAKIGVAMGNASDSCKAAADYVTDDIENDGLYKACIAFGWINK